MGTKLKIAVLGDYNTNIISHQCIPKALDLAARILSIEAVPVWIETDKINRHQLDQYDGVWCTPGSPYKDRQAVLDAIRFARASSIPYLGTCGGYQHAILEFAQNSLGLIEAELEEENPNAAIALISALPCRLRSERKSIRVAASSNLCRHLGSNQIEEEYQCGFGMNPLYQTLFEKSDLQFVAFNEDGAPQAFELRGSPFFIGTAFQPERSSRQNTSHPLIAAFLSAAR
jgi:CTP synthase (UTP-ammonia lyase)